MIEEKQAIAGKAAKCCRGPGHVPVFQAYLSQYSADTSKEQILLSDAHSKNTMSLVWHYSQILLLYSKNLLDLQSTEMRSCCFWHMLDVCSSLRQVTSPLVIHSLLLHWEEICLPRTLPPCMDVTECTVGTIVRIALQARCKKTCYKQVVS